MKGSSGRRDSRDRWIAADSGAPFFWIVVCAGFWLAAAGVVAAVWWIVTR